jgi:hypothetical protein
MLTRFILDNFSLFEGARVHGTVPVTERLANSVLQEQVVARQPKVLALSVEFREGNRIRVRCRIDAWWAPRIDAELSLDRTIENPAMPRIVVRPVSWWARAIIPFVEQIGQIWSRLPAFLVVENGRIVIDLLSIPGFESFRVIARHLKSLRLTTENGKLLAAFALSVEQVS